MTDRERAYLASLPAVVDVWRGCYAANTTGFSWSTEEQVARRFPQLNRYSQAGQPLLVHGQVRKSSILFVKLDRDEFEVVVFPQRVRIVATMSLPAPRRAA
jgi:hypothetical protein